MKHFIDSISDAKIKAFRWDKYEYGDLYSICYLKDYKFKRTSYAEKVKILPDTAKAIDLWIIGDSYVEKMQGVADSILYSTKFKGFYLVSGLKFAPRHVNFNTKHKKVLLIERAERFFRKELMTSAYANYLVTGNAGRYVAKPVNIPDTSKRSLTDYRLIPRAINQNIETVLFGYEMTAPLKETRAAFNYKLFNQNDAWIFVSKNKKRLYLNDTVDSTNISSSFKSISDEEIDSIVANMNYIAEEYKKKGFDEVVFSIIPNPVSIIEPNLYTYNNLIQRVQTNKNLKVPLIDVYSAFKENPDPDSLYWRSDTHWNTNGFNIWLDKMNTYLKTYISKPE